MKHIFAKIYIIRIYFAYIFFIKVRYIRQNIFNIYFKALEIYFRDKNLYMSHVYFIFIREGSDFTVIFNFLSTSIFKIINVTS